MTKTYAFSGWWAALPIGFIFGLGFALGLYLGSN